MNIGNAIRHIRKEKGLRQKDLIEITGLSQVFMSELERSKKMPSWPTLGQIADVLGTSVSYIIVRSVELADLKEGDRANQIGMVQRLEDLLYELKRE